MSFLSRLFGPPDVAGLEAKQDVPRLIKALGHKKNTEVRRSAAAALGRTNDADAVEALVAALSDHDSGVRRTAASALARLGDARAVEPLAIALTGSRSVDETWAMADALGKLDTPRAMGLLESVLSDGAEWKRKSALSLLSDMRWIPSRDVIPLLVGLLQNYERQIRVSSADALRRLYSQGNLTEKDKQLVLSQRERISEPHTDLVTHTDDGDDHADYETHQDSPHSDQVNPERGSHWDVHEDQTDHTDRTSSHWDSTRHDDRGIGVGFPL